ncbi:MAG: endolytic transglycosylase MltG [Deltaproteobacteria bacterium]|jgi:UPF0755 protein|nr:endolytic transglycosylase MltG [Deltaproteobacteria bacterium]
MRALRVLAVLVVLGLVAFGAGVVWFDRGLDTPLDPSGQERELLVPKGATLNQVGRLLREEKLIADERVLRIWARIDKSLPAPKAGRHKVSSAMNLRALVQALAENPIPDDVPLTMIEGWRLRDADAALAEKGLITAGEYQAAAQDASKFKLPFRIEGKELTGYLMPETYLVPPGKLDVHALIQRQLDAFHERFQKPYAEEIEKSGRTLQQIVIMASLLEREEPNPNVRPQVAGVLYRRLDAKTPLGVDATSHYSLDDWNDRPGLLRQLRDPNDPYNTRLKAGLPPGPIGAPSLPSLLAALRPVPSEFWYYLHDSNQQIHFAKTGEEHEANRRRYNVY